MKHKLRLVITIAFAVVFLLSSVSVLAAWYVCGSTTNLVSLATVSGKIIEEYVEEQVVYPGGEVTKKAVVRNTSTVNAITRVKVTNAWSGKENASELSADAIKVTFNKSDWLYKDGYYYYKKILKPGDTTTPLITDFTLSPEVGNDYAGAKGAITLNMEMLQAGGGAESTWCITYEDLGISYVPSVAPLLDTEITFNGKDEGFSFKGNYGDLFANFKNMVPGESVTQLITVTSRSDEEAELLLWAENDKKNSANEEALARKLLASFSRLVITSKSGAVIYDGALLSEKDSDRLNVSLGTFNENETKELYVTLTLSPEIGNDFESLEVSLDWGLSANGKDTPVPETGDSNKLLPLIITAVVSGAVFCFLSVSALRKRAITPMSE